MLFSAASGEICEKSHFHAPRSNFCLLLPIQGYGKVLHHGADNRNIRDFELFAHPAAIAAPTYRSDRYFRVGDNYRLVAIPLDLGRSKIFTLVNPLRPKVLFAIYPVVAEQTGGHGKSLRPTLRPVPEDYAEGAVNLLLGI